MFCTECGANIDGARFCPSCGKPVQQMNIQPAKCSKCGAELQEGMRFCNQCGTPVGAMNSQTSPVQSAPPMQPKEQAQQSWKARQAEQENQAKQAREAWQAKLNQGNAQQGQSSIQPKEPSAVTQKSTVQPHPKAQPQKKIQKSQTDQGQMGQVPGEVGFDPGMITSMDAASSVGETLLGKISFEEKVKETVAGTPISEFFRGVGGFFGGIFGSIVKPWKLLLAAALTFAWILLDKYQDSPQTLVKIASWLTFAQGGRGRETLPGLVGGLFGKGVTAAAWASIFTGGAGNAVKGISNLFQSGEKKSLVGAIFGAAIGAGLYVLFTGWGLASVGTSMAGVSGALLCLEGIGGKGGWFYNMACAFTAKKQDGVRLVQNGKAVSILAGMATGFVASAAFFALR